MDLSSRVRRNFLFVFLVVLVVAYFLSAETETVNAADAALATAFNENQVLARHLDGRNVAHLVSLQAGVAFPAYRTVVPAWDTRNGAVNGARGAQSNVSVDGIASNDES